MEAIQILRIRISRKEIEIDDVKDEIRVLAENSFYENTNKYDKEIYSLYEKQLKLEKQLRFLERKLARLYNKNKNETR